MRTKTILISVVTLILLVLGTYVVKIYIEKQNYTRARPVHGEITEAVYSLGKVKTNKRFEVKIGVLATIGKLYVKEGDLVSKNQELVSFDTGGVIRSPIEGTVTMVALYEKETALPQMPVVRVENLKDRFIELSVEQESALRIKKMQNAKISFESLRGKTLVGQVSAVYPKNDEFIVNIHVADLDESVLPGMTADVSIEVGVIQGLLIPIRAIRNGFVTISRNGKIQKVKVDIGLTDSLSAEIKGDAIQDSDEILVPRG